MFKLRDKSALKIDFKCVLRSASSPSLTQRISNNSRTTTGIQLRPDTLDKSLQKYYAISDQFQKGIVKRSLSHQDQTAQKRIQQTTLPYHTQKTAPQHHETAKLRGGNRFLCFTSISKFGNIKNPFAIITNLPNLDLRHRFILRALRTEVALLSIYLTLTKKFLHSSRQS